MAASDPLAEYRCLGLFGLEVPTRGEPIVRFRLPKLAILTLEAEARGVGVCPSACVRALVIARLAQRGENMGLPRSVAHKQFDGAVKRFILAYQIPVGVAGPPASTRQQSGFQS
jgi:hypothetical protein